MGKRRVVMVVVVIVAGLVAGGMYAKKADSGKDKELLFSGTVESHEVQVGSKVGGRISEILVREGDLVKAGDPLMRFDISELHAERSQLEARIGQAEANLRKLENGYRTEEIEQAEAAAEREKASLSALRNGPRPQQIDEARADLEAEKANLENARTTFQRLDSVYSSGYISRQERDDAATRQEQAKNRVEAARQRLALLEAGTRSEDIKAGEERYNQAMANARMMHSGYRTEDIADARARLSEAKATLEQLKVKIAEGEIRSPAESRVEVVSVRPGDLVMAGKPAIKLLEQDQVWVRIYVPEPSLGQIKVGQKATIKVDSFTDREFAGSVEQISEQAEFTPRNVQSRNERNHQVFGVKVRIENNREVFKPGMAADVRLAVE